MIVRIYYTRNHKKEWVSEIAGGEVEMENQVSYFSFSDTAMLAWDKAVILAEKFNISIHQIEWLHRYNSKGKIINLV